MNLVKPCKTIDRCWKGYLVNYEIILKENIYLNRISDWVFSLVKIVIEIMLGDKHIMGNNNYIFYSKTISLILKLLIRRNQFFFAYTHTYNKVVG